MRFRFVLFMGVVCVEGRKTLGSEEVFRKQLREPRGEWIVWGEGEVGVCGGGECGEEFIFTVTSLREVRDSGDLPVILTLEVSQFPQVIFTLSLRSRGDEGEVLLREAVMLEVNELRRVELRVCGLQWEAAELEVKASPVGHPEISKTETLQLRKLTSDLEVFVQTDKKEYSAGETVNYRAVVVDESVDTPKFLHGVVGVASPYSSVVLPPVEVPRSGVLLGNFTFKNSRSMEVSVTSNLTSVPMATASADFESEKTRRPDSISLNWSAEVDAAEDVYFSQPTLKGRLRFLVEGFPADAKCHVKIHPSQGNETERGISLSFTKKREWRNLTLSAEDVTSGDFEFDVVEQLGAVKGDVEGNVLVHMPFYCTHPYGFSHGAVFQLWTHLYKVGFLEEAPPRLFRPGNSSHPQTTVVLRFLVERRDGGSVEEEEPSKGLRVELLLSGKNSERLRPSATEFSLPIPEDGVVRLEFDVKDTPPSPWNDKIRLSVGDVIKVESLHVAPRHIFPKLRVSFVDPVTSIRKGDVVRFRVRSFSLYGGVNAVLSSSKALYSSHRFSFSPQGEELDEVVDLTIPQNVTEGSLTLQVFGVSSQLSRSSVKSLQTSSLKLNVIPSSGPQEIKIVDQVDGDLSTSVTFRLDGLLKNSVLSLQATKLEATNGEFGKFSSSKAERCRKHWEIRNDSPPMGDSNKINVAASVLVVEDQTSHCRDKPQSLLFFDVVRKTPTEDKGTLIITKIFDRLTQSGSFVVSGDTFSLKTGRTAISSSPVLKILPPPVNLSVSVPPFVLLGETMEVLGYVKNNLDTPFEGHVTLESTQGGSTEVTDKLVKVNPNSYKILKFQMTPQLVGEVVLSLKSNISSRLTATKRVKVNPTAAVYRSTKFILAKDNQDFGNWTPNIGNVTFDLPQNCSPIGEPKVEIFEADILGDIFSFVQGELFGLTCESQELWVPCLLILSSLGDFKSVKKQEAALRKVREISAELRDPLFRDKFLSQVPFEDESIVDIAAKVRLGAMLVSPEPWSLQIEATKRLSYLSSMQQMDGSFLNAKKRENFNPLEKELMASQGYKANKLIVDTATALLVLRNVNGSKFNENPFGVFSNANFKRGVEYLRKAAVAGQINDNLPLSLVALLFSQVEVPNTHHLFRMLETSSSNNSEGMFWKSKWKGKDLTKEQTPSIAATSFALMTYVNLKKAEQASEISRWLISKKNDYGIYASFEETAMAVESLSRYATFMATVKGEWPFVVKVTKTCEVYPQNDVSNKSGVSVNAYLRIPKESLQMPQLGVKVCRGKSNWYKPKGLAVLELSLPSGYQQFTGGRRRSDGTLIEVIKPIDDCTSFSAFRTTKVFQANLSQETTRGSVTYYEFSDPPTRSVKLFDVTLGA